MSISVYDQTVGAMSHMLRNLDAIVSKAETHAEQHSIDPNALLQARLFPNMLNFIVQIGIATDIGKGAAARLSGGEVPVWDDIEASFAGVHARIHKTLDYLAGFEPSQFTDSEDRAISLTIGGQSLEFTGQDYILQFVLPNFYFHVTTAYDILRHNGLDIGKRDFLGGS